MWCRALAAAVFILAGFASAGVQGRPIATSQIAQSAGASDPAPQPGLDLTPEQRHVLFASISSKTHVSTAAPPDFLPKPGDVVPASVELQPLPQAALELIPKLQGYVCALVANQALLVDPQSRRIIEVISESTPQSAPARS